MTNKDRSAGQSNSTENSDSEATLSQKLRSLIDQGFDGLDLKEKADKIRGRIPWADVQAELDKIRDEREPKAHSSRRNESADAETRDAQARAEQIANNGDIPAVFAKALLDFRGYIASPKLATTVLISHGARLLPACSGFLFVAQSGGGKTDLLRKGAEFLPVETCIEVTSCSKQFWNYLEDVKQKYILGGELKPIRPGEDDEAQSYLRQLISDNKITRGTVEPDSKGVNQKQIHTTEGPASIVFTTTSNPQSLNDEFVNRLSIVFVDDGSDMTRQVIDAQARSAASLPDSNKLRRARVEIAAFHLYHASLEPLKVVIPFAEKIKITSVDNPTSRRLNQLVYSYIKVLALLHQKTRIRGLHHGIEYITATKCDYEIAYELMVANAPNVLELVPNAARSRFQILSSRFKDELDDPIWFTSSDVQLALKLSKEQTNRDLRALVSAGCLKKNDARQPSYKVASDLPPTADIGLVHPSQVETHRVIPDAFICDPLYVNATQRLEASGHEVTEKAQAKIVEIEID